MKWGTALAERLEGGPPAGFVRVRIVGRDMHVLVARQILHGARFCPELEEPGHGVATPSRPEPSRTADSFSILDPWPRRGWMPKMTCCGDDAEPRGTEREAAFFPRKDEQNE